MNLKRFKNEMKKSKFKINLLDYFLNSCLYIFSVEMKPSQELLEKYLSDNVFSDIENLKYFLKKLQDFYNYIVFLLDLDLKKNKIIVNSFISELLKGYSNEEIKKILLEFTDKFIFQAMKDYNITTEMIENFDEKSIIEILVSDYESLKNEDKIILAIKHLMILSDELVVNKKTTLKELKNFLFELIFFESFLNFIRRNNFIDKIRKN